MGNLGGVSAEMWHIIKYSVCVIDMPHFS
uniref:Uncharacterized protein n=1 Tax=Anguilla anguilla TaxID=7936 RepID=A0A0E9RW72_ANGAN